MNVQRIVYCSLIASAILVCAAPAQSAVIFKLVTQLDAAALDAGVPGSVAAYGNNVYVGGLFGGGQIHNITDPLGTPVNSQTFGGGALPGNGYVSLNTDGTTLVAATNNAAAADIAQAYSVAGNTLNWSKVASGLAAPNRIDGAAVDPITGNVILTAFGGGSQRLFTAAAPGAAVPGATTSLFDGGAGNVGTGFRDVDFDNATGDIFLRAVNGVARGRRDLVSNPGAPGDYDRLDGTTAGIETIVQLADGFNSAINVEFLPASFAGQELVIFNFRNGANTFNDQVLVYDATAVNAPVATTFLTADGAPFSTTNAADGIYDFSYDPVNSLLYISDFSTSQVHVFGVVPEPSSFVLVAGFASIATTLFRRRH